MKNNSCAWVAASDPSSRERATPAENLQDTWSRLVEARHWQVLALYAGDPCAHANATAELRRIGHVDSAGPAGTVGESKTKRPY